WRVKADGSQVAAGSAATGEDGTYALPSLLPGDYRLRFSAEGFAETWYRDPAVDDPANAEIVRIEPAEPRTGLDVAIGGETGAITGAVALPPGSAGTPLTVTATLITETSPAGGDAGAGAGAGEGAGEGDGAGADGPVTFEQTTT